MPYSKYRPEDLILRDELAIDRTILAVERTLLSYLRASVSLVLAGLTILGLITSGWFIIVGYIIIPIGILLGIFGIVRSIEMNRKIKILRKKST